MPARSIRHSAVAALALTLFCLHSAADAHDLIAIVDLKFIRSTDQTATVLCFGDKDEDCVVWATLNVYQARIRKVISGTESRKTMLVAFGRHALGDHDLPRMVAIMKKLDAESPNDPLYRIVGSGDKREMYCFPRAEDDTEGFELKKDGEQSLTCYDEEPAEIE